MKAFAALYTELDGATSTQRKLAALVRYFGQAAARDAAWAAYFLAGGKPRQSARSAALRQAAGEAAAIPPWLFEECYDAVGDMAETIALVLPDSTDTSDIGLADCMTSLILPLRALPLDQQIAGLQKAWLRLDRGSRFVFNKLITGSFRVGVSRLLLTQALARLSGVDAGILAQRMMGYLASRALPSASDYMKLMAEHDPSEPNAQPFPFFLAQSLQSAPELTLGDAAEWLVEWKWDGMRGQLVKRGGSSQLWSRGDELISERFPELMEMAAALPDGCVLDGEVIAWRDGEGAGDAGEPLPFGKLQTRMARKTVSTKLMAEVPIVFIAYDLLEFGGSDIRSSAMASRRAKLSALLESIDDRRLKLSEAIVAADWAQLAQVRDAARERGAEGLMLKRLDSAYGIGRTKRELRGEWWKWKLDPMSVDAVLVYAQRGHGRRAGLYTDYSFAVWDDGDGNAEANGERKLVPFAKAYSGLTDAEIRQVDAFIKRNTLEKFGPVRTVKPQLVMEIGFEGIQASKRHKCGVAVRFPRILRVRSDKPMEEADSLQSLKALAGAA